MRCDTSGVATTYFATSSHEMSKCTCASAGSSSISSRISRWLGLRSVALALADGCVGWITRPNPVCAQMIVASAWRRSRSFICDKYTGSAPALANGMSMSLWSSTTSPTLGREIEDPVERGIGEARDVAGHLRRDELLVDRELADTCEHARERRQHALDVIHAVHVGRVEPRDHRIEARLLARRQRAIRHRDVGVRERVVVERRVGLQVVRGPKSPEFSYDHVCCSGMPNSATRPTVSPMISRNAPDVRAFLNVVRQVEVDVVDLIVGALRERRHGCRRRADDRPNDAGPQNAQPRTSRRSRWRTRLARGPRLGRGPARVCRTRP